MERQNKAFKYDYLEGHKHLTLSSMLSVLLEEFLPDKYLRYGVVIETHIKSLESVCVWVGVEMGRGGRRGKGRGVGERESNPSALSHN